MCDRCECDLDDELIDCFRFEFKSQQISHHNGDEYEVWSPQLILCKKCGIEVGKFAKPTWSVIS